MKTVFKHIITLTTALLGAVTSYAQMPTIAPTAVYTDKDGNEVIMNPGDLYSGSAPLAVKFTANTENEEGWTEYYEWRFFTEGKMENPYLTRYEKDTEFTFVTGGAQKIVCYATFTKGTQKVEYTADYWTTQSVPFGISISESILEMPNAFSPKNGDDLNNTYKPKKGYQSIVEFHAYIFNRWGTKLYEWHNVDEEGWDGTYKGRDMPVGVYFCLVKAKGADGREFTIKRDVNLFRGFTPSTTTTDGAITQ